MASLKRMRERTVAFYEIVESRAGERQRLAPMKWPEFLATLSLMDLEPRTVETDTTLIGEHGDLRREDHLLLHRAKESGEWLSVLNWDTGEWRELEMKAAE